MTIPRRRFIKILAAQGGLLACGPLASKALGKTASLRTWNGIVLGAHASIQLSCSKSDDSEKLLKKCLAEIQRLEKIFSLYYSESALVRLNRNKELDNPPPELVELLRFCREMGDQTFGVFDISIHSLVEAYQKHFELSDSIEGFSPKPALSAVDYRTVDVNTSLIRYKNPNTLITLNGVAQGYITDKIAQLLSNHGIDNTLIDLGEKRALGQHPAGRAWNLGLANQDGVHRTVPLENRALASSGGYGTSFGSSGKYHHLIDPRTGLPVNDNHSIHVTAPNATLADAISTSLATCRKEEAELIEKRFPEITVFRS